MAGYVARMPNNHAGKLVSTGNPVGTTSKKVRPNGSKPGKHRVPTELEGNSNEPRTVETFCKSGYVCDVM